SGGTRRPVDAPASRCPSGRNTCRSELVGLDPCEADLPRLDLPEDPQRAVVEGLDHRVVQRARSKTSASSQLSPSSCEMLRVPRIRAKRSWALLSSSSRARA